MAKLSVHVAALSLSLSLSLTAEHLEGQALVSSEMEVPLSLSLARSQVVAEHLEDQALVPAEEEVLLQPHDAGRVERVLVVEELEKLDLRLRLRERER